MAMRSGIAFFVLYFLGYVFSTEGARPISSGILSSVIVDATLTSVKDESPCANIKQQCDFFFEDGKNSKLELIGEGTNVYDHPVIVDKYGNPLSHLRANGKCTVVSSTEGESCDGNFFFRNSRISTTPFKVRKVTGFRHQCIRLDITSATFANIKGVRAWDATHSYPHQRRCIMFETA